MACPNCGCKVTYPVYDPEDYEGYWEDYEHCANCNHLFSVEDGIDDEDDYTEVDENDIEQEG